jgi:nitroreductase
MSAITDALSWRYATKKFDPAKKLSDADLEELTNVLRLSPSSYGIQPWKFLIISDPAIRSELRKAAWDQAQITDASHLVVLCAKTTLRKEDIDEYIAHIATTRGIGSDALTPLHDMIMGSLSRQTPEGITGWNQKQVYIALGLLLSAAAQKQIDSCPMEGFDATAFDNILGLSAQGLTATVLCPLGYRAADDEAAQHAKVRFPKDKIVQTL